MSQILIDRITSITLHSGIVRIDCVWIGPNGEERPSGSLLIPAAQAEAIMKSMVGSLQELDKKLREHRQAAGPAAGTA
jgi:hypothetical protein